MCDAFSFVIRRDGAYAHVPENSHSGAVRAAGWRENDQMADMRGQFFVEAEWDAEGKFPGASKITRGEPTEKQLKVVETIYTAISALLTDPSANAERMLFDGGIFSGEEYADLRWRMLNLESTPKKVIKRLIARTFYADAQKPITSLHPAINKINGSIAIAAGAKIVAKNLAEVSGYVYVSANATFTAPALAEVSGNVDVRENATFTAPALVKSGNVYVSANATFTAPALVKSGYVDVHKTGKLDAPKLKRR